MDRRRFLQLAGLAGLAVAAPVGLSSVARADVARYEGPYWIMVDAGGGWDPTMLCDPKGGTADDRDSVNQTFTKGEIGRAGNIAYAPVSLTIDDVEVFSCKRFFDAHKDRLLVINGVDTTTNSHDSGTRTVWSGRLTEGYPSFGALAAGVVYADNPLAMAFLSGGGYDATAGVVSLTRTNGIDAAQKLAYPNVIDPGDSDSDRYNSNETSGRILAAEQARLQAMRKRARFSRDRDAMSSLFLARSSNDGMVRLAEQLGKSTLIDLDDVPDLAGVGNLGDLESLMRQAQLALIAFQAGVAVSANLSIGGFDTHDDHDDRQGRQLMKLLRGLDYLYTQIDALGLKDKVYVVVGSDFGRTPYYNSGDGKDHWNITSMLASGPGIAGNRVIGSTDDGYRPGTFSTSLQPDPNGIRIETPTIHKALRKLAGIDKSKVATQFPLPGPELPLFG